MTADQEPTPVAALRKNKAGAPRHALTRDLIEAARSARDRGTDTSFAIDNPRGLFIRVRNKEIQYYVQARGPCGIVKRKICPISAINFSGIKKIGVDAVTAIKNGRDVTVAIESGLAKKSEREVDIALDRADASAQVLWTFGVTIDQFSSRTVTRNGVTTRKLSQSSLREIQDRLRNRPEAESLMNRYVKELRIEDLEQIRDIIDACGGGASSGAKFVDLSKRVLNWAAKFRRRLTGLDPAHPWWNALAHEYRPADRNRRFLTPAQIGMMIALLEGVRSLENRADEAVFAALQLAWMIVQRSAALVGIQSLTSDRWKGDPVEERKDWRVYTWNAEEVKSKREIRLSIPPMAISILERVANNRRAVTGIESAWAFPQARNKYLIRNIYEESGSAAKIREIDKHITPSSLNHALDALGGRKPGWPNLLQMVDLPDRIGPHDLRRSLTTFFDNRGEGSYASALLDHVVTGKDRMSEHVANITQGVYSAADRVIFKSEGLGIWLAAVLPFYEKAKLDPRLAAAIEARRVALERAKGRGLEKRAATLAVKRAERIRNTEERLLSSDDLQTY